MRPSAGGVEDPSHSGSLSNQLVVLGDGLLRLLHLDFHPLLPHKVQSGGGNLEETQRDSALLKTNIEQPSAVGVAKRHTRFVLSKYPTCSSRAIPLPAWPRSCLCQSPSRRCPSAAPPPGRQAAHQGSADKARPVEKQCTQWTPAALG